MWRNPQFPVNLVTFTEEILNRKLHFLCSDLSVSPPIWKVHILAHMMFILKKISFFLLKSLLQVTLCRLFFAKVTILNSSWKITSKAQQFVRNRLLCFIMRLDLPFSIFFASLRNHYYRKKGRKWCPGSKQN